MALTIGPHVFGDNRLGLWVISPTNLQDRLPKIRAFCAGAITDVFVPWNALPQHREAIVASGAFCSMWTTPGNTGPIRFAEESLAAFDRVKPGALELNIEKPDDRMRDFVRDCVGHIRKSKPKLRLRVNIAPFKAQFLPVYLFKTDPNLYLIEQAYFGNMDGRASESDVLMDMLGAGVPMDKCSVMYGAANVDPLTTSTVRVPSLPAMTIRRLRRGSIFSDDLMADVGLL